jgi:hypothetical protein
MHHEIPSCWYLQKIPSKNFPDAPANSIAHHRPAQRLFHADSEPAALASIGTVENHELR